MAGERLCCATCGYGHFLDKPLRCANCAAPVVVTIDVSASDADAERAAYERGRADEKADVVAHLPWHFTAERAKNAIQRGEHVGASKKGGA